MKRWALIEGGKIANVVEQETAPEIAGNWVEAPAWAGPGHTYAGGSFAIPAAAPVRRLTKLQFIGRLTPTEAKGLLAAAESDPDVRLFVRMLDWATPDADGTSVDLDDERTVAAIEALFSGGRAAEILA